MLRFILIENNKDYVSYRYFPEGREPSGVISVNKSSKDIIELSIAPKDTFKRYFFHMLRRIESFIDSGKYEEQGIIAWC